MKSTTGLKLRGPGRRRVKVFSLGGTISSTERTGAAVGDGVEPRLSANDLLSAIPGIQDIADVEAISFRQLPSSDISIADVIELWSQICASFSDGVDGVVVTQGTDTLEDTAYILDLLHSGEQPIVLTGAMRHASALGADGPANLYEAIATAASEGSRGLGALVVFAGEIHAARWVSKRHTSSVAAFTSPNVGPIGWVVEGRPSIALRPVVRLNVAPPQAEMPPVATIAVGMGDDDRIWSQLQSMGFRGVVIQAMGGGHVPGAMVAHLASLAKEIPVVLASRAGSGPILRDTYGSRGSEKDLLASGLISAGALDAPKARLLLILLLASAVTAGEDLRLVFARHSMAYCARQVFETG